VSLPTQGLGTTLGISSVGTIGVSLTADLPGSVTLGDGAGTNGISATISLPDATAGVGIGTNGLNATVGISGVGTFGASVGTGSVSLTADLSGATIGAGVGTSGIGATINLPGVSAGIGLNTSDISASLDVSGLDTVTEGISLVITSTQTLTIVSESLLPGTTIELPGIGTTVVSAVTKSITTEIFFTITQSTTSCPQSITDHTINPVFSVAISNYPTCSDWVPCYTCPDGYQCSSDGKSNSS